MTDNSNIPISKPDLNQSDFQEIKRCFDSSWISSKSDWVKRFEERFAKIVSQTKYAIAVNSGTSALFLALKALGIRTGDEVVIPTFTMVATVNAVSWAGARPVLVDCASKKDWNIDASLVEEKITKRTKAIVPVHIYGYPCQMDKILETAKKHRLFVIEDAAEAMGARFEGKQAGSFGDIACFSLYVNKTITTGNGGMIATNSRKFYLLLKRLSFFDIEEKKHFFHRAIGYNLVLSGLQAALGLSQLKRFNRFLLKRKTIHQWYKNELKSNKEVVFLPPSVGQDPCYWFPAVLFKDKKTKIKVVNYLKKYQVETREFFRPIHLQPAYKDLYENQYKNAEFFYHRGLLLPSYHQLDRKTVGQISSLIKKCL